VKAPIVKAPIVKAPIVKAPIVKPPTVEALAVKALAVEAPAVNVCGVTTASGPEVHVVLPNDIDDPTAPSGGNRYDRRICHGLAAMGWSVREHAVPGSWPQPSAADRASLARVLAILPEHAVVLLDGLVASSVPEVLWPHAGRLRLAILVHMPLGDACADVRPIESRALSAAAVIVTTSPWSRQRLVQLYGVPAGRIHVAVPGVDPAPLVAASDSGSRLLCVGAITPAKGYEELVQALSTLPDLPWSCVCVGAREREPGFADWLRQQAEAVGMASRISFPGPRSGGQLESRYAAADLLVLASRAETYGMVVTEALAHGIPVLATAVGGLPEAMGRAPDGSRPGILVPAQDPAALAGALRRWLREADLRRRLRQSAGGRRGMLTRWTTTSEVIARALCATAQADAL
jgi:glycosyltransferase involved in cell wall biosynthesis